jgi:ABC-type Fe3+ transport system substrate-binding protein
MWDDRARVFQAAMQRPEYKGRTWNLVRTIATRGWAAVGGPGAWGKLKLMQSDPTKSNSGQSALALIFAEYRRDHPSATATDPGFARFMQDIQGQVGSFGDTTSKVMEAFINGGPDSADMAVVYETNALTAVDKGASNVRVVYPEPTLVQEYPAAILAAPWVTPEKAEVAREYVRYLLRPEVQKRAVEYGLRPALLELRGAVDTAFASGNRAQAGFKLDTQTVIRPVSTVIMDGVLYQWYKRYGKP